MADAEKKSSGSWTENLLKNGLISVLVVGAIVVVFLPGDHMGRLTLAIGFGLMVLIFLYGLMILLEIANGRIDIRLLLSESTGGASMSRFQLLIFTFVISLSFFLLVAKSKQFPNVPPDVLALLGISASTYAVSKGIQATGMPPKTLEPPPTPPQPPPTPAAQPSAGSASSVPSAKKPDLTL